MGLRDALRAATGRSPVVERALSLDAFGPSFGFSDSPRHVLGGSLEGGLRSVPLFAAVRLIADTFASTPLHSYRERPGRSRERLPADPLLLKPVSGQLSSWKTQCIVSLLGFGNAFAYATTVDARGWPAGIVWLDPAQTWCDENILRPRWQYQGQDIDSTRLLHIPWILSPGRVTGLAPLDQFRLTMETGHSALGLAHDLYANGAVPLGHFKNTGRVLDTEQAEILADRFDARIKGRKNLVTGQDWSYATIGLPPDQVAYVEAQKMSANHIASIFGVSPEDIGGETGSSMTYSTVEMNGLKLATQTMRPWFSRVEEALSTWLPDNEYLKFNSDALVRADLKTRLEAHKLALDSGVETNDEARALEDRPPLTNAQRSQWLSAYRKTPDAAPVAARTTEQEES